MRQYDFPAPGPVQTRIRVRSTDVSIAATDAYEVSVQLIGDDELAERTQVDFSGEVLEVDVPQVRSGLFSAFSSSSRMRIEVAVPVGSNVLAKAGSGDVRTAGELGEVEVRTGSGDLYVGFAHRATTNSGSGDARVDRAVAVEAFAGSGSIAVGDAEEVSARTGSGDITVEHAVRLHGTTGSGDLRIGETSVATLRSGSGSIQVRKVRSGEVGASTGSGNLTVGVADGTPTMLDCQAASGRVRSELEPSGEPGEGEDSVVLRLRAASGNITVLRA